jgi:hypothetical protein
MRTLTFDINTPRRQHFSPTLRAGSPTNRRSHHHHYHSATVSFAHSAQHSPGAFASGDVMGTPWGGEGPRLPYPAGAHDFDEDAVQAPLSPRDRARPAEPPTSPRRAHADTAGGSTGRARPMWPSSVRHSSSSPPVRPVADRRRDLHHRSSARGLSPSRTATAIAVELPGEQQQSPYASRAAEGGAPAEDSPAPPLSPGSGGGPLNRPQPAMSRSHEDALVANLIHGANLLKHTRLGRGRPHPRYVTFNVTQCKVQWRTSATARKFHAEEVTGVINGASDILLHRAVTVRENDRSFSLVTPNYKHNIVFVAEDVAERDAWVAGIRLALLRRVTGWNLGSSPAGIYNGHGNMGSNLGGQTQAAPGNSTLSAGGAATVAMAASAFASPLRGTRSAAPAAADTGRVDRAVSYANYSTSPTRSLAAPLPSSSTLSYASGAQEPGVTEVYALFDYDGENKTGHLAFRKGEKLTVVDTSGRNWWMCRGRGGRIGRIPLNQVARRPDDGFPIASDRGRIEAMASEATIASPDPWAVGDPMKREETSRIKNSSSRRFDEPELPIPQQPRRGPPLARDHRE